MKKVSVSKLFKARGALLTKSDGFTLIELLIVITLLGLVVALLVGIFGSPLKFASIENSVTQIADQIRSIADGADYYYARKTTAITSLNNLTTEGILKVIPTPPASAKAEGYQGTFEYALNSDTYKAWGNTNANDIVVQLTGVTSDVCKKVNEKFAAMAPNADIPTNVNATKDIQCIKSGDNNVILKVLHVDA